MAKVELEKQSEKSLSTRGVALRGPKKPFLADFVSRMSAKFAVGALLVPLFGQFLEWAFSEVRVAPVRWGPTGPEQRYEQCCLPRWSVLLMVLGPPTPTMKTDTGVEI